MAVLITACRIGLRDRWGDEAMGMERERIVGNHGGGGKGGVKPGHMGNEPEGGEKGQTSKRAEEKKGEKEHGSATGGSKRRSEKVCTVAHGRRESSQRRGRLSPEGREIQGNYLFV